MNLQTEDDIETTDDEGFFEEKRRRIDNTVHVRLNDFEQYGGKPLPRFAGYITAVTTWAKHMKNIEQLQLSSPQNLSQGPIIVEFDKDRQRIINFRILDADVPTMEDQISLQYIDLLHRDLKVRSGNEIRDDLKTMLTIILQMYGNQQHRNHTQNHSVILNKIMHHYTNECNVSVRETWIDTGDLFSLFTPIDEVGNVQPHLYMSVDGFAFLKRDEQLNTEITIRSIINHIARIGRPVVVRGVIQFGTDFVEHQILTIWDKNVIYMYDPNGNVDKTFSVDSVMDGKKFQNTILNFMRMVPEHDLVPLTTSCLNTDGENDYFKCFEGAQFEGYCVQITELIILLSMYTGITVRQSIHFFHNNVNKQTIIDITETFIGMIIQMYYAETAQEMGHQTAYVKYASRKRSSNMMNAVRDASITASRSLFNYNT